MSYKIETIPRFDKDVKKLKQRFPKIKDEVLYLVAMYSKSDTDTIITDKLKEIIRNNIS